MIGVNNMATPSDSITHSVAHRIEYETRDQEYSNIITVSSRRAGLKNTAFIFKTMTQRYCMYLNVQDTTVREGVVTLPKSPEWPSWLRKMLVFSSLQIFMQHQQ